MNAQLEAIELFHSALTELSWTELSRAELSRTELTRAELSWAELSLTEFSREPFSQHNTHGLMSANCLLETVLRLATQHRDLLNECGVQHLRSLHASGYQLFYQWPRSSFTAVQEWIGSRLFWLDKSSSQIVHNQRLQSIVSSQLGKGKQNLTQWPTLLDWAAQLAVRDQAALLLVEGTTLYAESLQFAETAAINCIEIRNASDSKVKEENAIRSVIQWLKDRLQLADGASPGVLDKHDTNAPQAVRAVVEVSPAWSDAPDSNLAGTAQQDRLSIALSDRVAALHIRENGTIAKLLQLRLTDERFGLGGCFLAIPQSIDSMQHNDPATDIWLDRGAVGYVVPIDDWNCLTSNIFPCASRSKLPSTQQVILPLTGFLNSNVHSNWSMLTHCTRGNSAAWPQESDSGYLRRVWEAGVVTTSDPFLMLLHILHEGRLRGSTWLTRGQSPVVSLSAVPLTDLLSRRTFRRHLGRWDWEPYGILFTRISQPQARQVTYGTESDYANMADDEKVFFQPQSGKQDWSTEQEWRVMGDIDLRAIRAEGALVFTRTRGEARQAATISPFPVLWVDETV